MSVTSRMKVRSMPKTIDFLHQNSKRYADNYLRILLDFAVDKWIFDHAPIGYSDPTSPDFQLEYTKTGISYVIIRPSIQSQISEKYIVWSHSMTTNISSNFYYLQMVAMEHGVNIVLYDYPGYGKTPWKGERAPSEKDYRKALVKVINFLRNEKGIKEEKLFLVGHELGCAITLAYAIKMKWKQPIMFIDCFTSLGDLIVRCMKDHIDQKGYSGAEIASHITHFRVYDRLDKEYICPIKMVHGMDNKACPISGAAKMNYRYSRTCQENGKYMLSSVWIPGCDGGTILLKLFDYVMNDFLHYYNNQITTQIAKQTINNETSRQINYTNYQKILDNL